MKPITEDMIRACIALQQAALDFDADDSDVRARGRQAILTIGNQLDILGESYHIMKRLVRKRT